MSVLAEIVGKQVAMVAWAGAHDKATMQLFLVFADGACLEVNGERLWWMPRLIRPEDIERRAASYGHVIYQIHDDPSNEPPAPKALGTDTPSPVYHVPAPRVPRHPSGWNLVAWLRAGRAIRKAKGPAPGGPAKPGG